MIVMGSFHNKIISIISSISITDENDITIDDALSNIGIDSLKKVELIIALEDEFNIIFEIDDLNPAKIITVDDVINLTDKYLQGILQ